jgi:hypothetical protein
MKIRLSIIIMLSSSFSMTIMAQPTSRSHTTEENSSVITQIDNTDNSITISQIDSSKIADITHITQIGSGNEIDITNGNKMTISQMGNHNLVHSTDTHSFHVHQIGDSNVATVTGDSGSVVIRQEGHCNTSHILQ